MYSRDAGLSRSVDVAIVSRCFHYGVRDVCLWTAHVAPSSVSSLAIHSSTVYEFSSSLSIPEGLSPGAPWGTRPKWEWSLEKNYPVKNKLKMAICLQSVDLSFVFLHSHLLAVWSYCMLWETVFFKLNSTLGLTVDQSINCRPMHYKSYLLWLWLLLLQSRTM